MSKKGSLGRLLVAGDLGGGGALSKEAPCALTRRCVGNRAETEICAYGSRARVLVIGLGGGAR